MERTEPTLVPEWLRCTGNGAGGGNSVHHSGVSSSANSPRTRYFRSNSEKGTQRPLDRSTSFNSRRSSSSNGSAKHPYSSFSRSRWDKNRDRDKEKPSSGDIWEIDSSDPLSSILTSSRIERSGLRRSQSLISRKPGEPLNRKVEDSRISGTGGSNLSVNQKSVFEKDFPSLGTEEKQGLTGIKRVLSPGLGSAAQSLTIGNSGFLSGDKWTSALIDVPPVLANNGVGHSSLPQSSDTVSNPSSGVSNLGCINMAEALSQPASRINANTQQPDRSQRIEELAIKQSRQLIPMTPSMPKTLVPGPSDKSKYPKISLRTNETTTGSKGAQTQPHPTHSIANQSRPGQTKPDSSSTSHTGKFLVLKPGREIITSGAKDGFSSDTNGRVINDGLSHPAMSPSIPSPTAPSSLRSNPMVSTLETNVAALTVSPRSNVDKKSYLAQSRREFFKLMRRKASLGSPTTQSCSSSSVLSTISETSVEKFKEGDADVRPHVLENGDGYKDTVEKKGFCDVGDNSSLTDNGFVYPDEEEAAFLRSLGWDENGEEDEGLTEEEINAFYQEYMNKRPSMELSRISQTKISTVSAVNTIPGVSNCSSESEPNA